jgi:uncharacterized membrane protein YraQ (UPF0718 family)
MRDTGKWVVLGIFLGALVTTFFPPELAQKWLSGGMTSYLIMLVAGLPLYVCATGSIPLAAAFLAVGASPGAALVFLTAGPATNTATMGFVAGVLGKRTFLAYFFSISLVSLSGGVLLDYYFADSMQSMGHHHHDTTNLWYWFQTLCTIVFLGLLFRVYITDFLKRSPAVAVDISYNRSYKIPAISCGGCILNIERALKPLSQTGDYRIDLESKTLYINGTISDKELRQKLAEAGYPPLT